MAMKGSNLQTPIIADEVTRRAVESSQKPVPRFQHLAHLASGIWRLGTPPQRPTPEALQPIAPGWRDRAYPGG